MIRLCTVCARGGSKGVKGKNVRMLHGKPLIAYSIEQARDSNLFRAIAVSSDSDHILEIAKAYGADHLVKRPDELATDASPKLPAIRHCVVEVERIRGEVCETIVDLDATSPLRRVRDIVEAVAVLEASAAGNLITAMPARRSPYFNLIELDGQGAPRLSKPVATSFVRRQDVPQCFDMNASIYVWRRQVLFDSLSIFNPDTHLYIMPEEHSIDIDSELDFKFVEFVMSTRPQDDRA
jgi:CMP-N,N'-diacetyllegionaminic acid synthase